MRDCKEENCKKIAETAPKITDYLCEDCKNHFEKVRALLDGQNVEYSVNSNELYNKFLRATESLPNRSL